MSRVPEMMPLNIPAALAYEMWSKHQAYQPIPWESLTPIQHDAWRRVAATVLNWYDETYDPLDEPTHHE